MYSLRIFKTILLLTGLSILCLDIDGQTWVQRASMPAGNGGFEPASFAINNKLYVAGGYFNGSLLRTTFEYDAVSNTWTRKADMPVNLYGAAYFSLNGKGYVICGVASGLVSSVYVYDPVTDSWSQKNNFPGGGRQVPTGFALNGKGYLVGGFTGGSSAAYDMWEYDATADTWTQKSDVPGNLDRNAPIAMILNNQAYVGMGCNGAGNTAYTDFYRYDPVSDSYTQLASIPVARDACAHFAIGGTGYVGIGQSGLSVIQDFYSYNVSTNSWTRLNNFGGSARGWGFSEVLFNEPYVGAGADLFGGVFFSDNWTWDNCGLFTNLGPDTMLCSGSILTLRDTTTGATFLWSTGDNTASINVTSSGRYWLQVNKNGCVGSDTINVTFVNPSANIDLGTDTVYCGGFTRMLSTGDPATVWSTGARGASILVSAPGLYWAEVSDPCGTKRDTINLFSSPLPAVNLGNDTNLCPGATITLDATVPGATYTWSDNTTSPVLGVSAAGTYWVDVQVNGCTNRDSILIGYITPSSFNIGMDTTYCGGFSRTISGGLANIIWNTGDTATSITITQPSLYIGTITACGATLSDSILISQNPIPNADLGNDTMLCSGITLSLDVTTAGGAYLWQDSSSGPTLVVSQPGTYWVDVIVNGCSKRDSIVVGHIVAPVVIGIDTTICEDSIMEFNVYQPYASYQWSTGDTTSHLTTTVAGQYTVTVSNVCGSATATENLATTQCACKIAIPTAFSPNGDGKNEQYGVLTICPLDNFEFSIYNRWGQKIFLTNDITDKWDGTYKGAPQPIGVYVYFFKYRDPYTHDYHQQSGNVTLLR